MTARTGYGLSAPDAGHLRASTADRERAADVLKAGYAEGRLSKAEYDIRTDQVFAARTLAELGTVTADLPGGHLAAPGAWNRAPRGTNSLAVASLICGIAQFVAGPLPTIPAIVLGHMARREIRRTGEDGNGLATVGLVLGWAGLSLMVLVALIALVVITAIRGHGGHAAG
jgi:uncharacterized membrane protein